MGIQKQLWIEQFSIFPYLHDGSASFAVAHEQEVLQEHQSYRGAVDAGVYVMAGLVESKGLL